MSRVDGHGVISGCGYGVMYEFERLEPRNGIWELSCVAAGKCGSF